MAEERASSGAAAEAFDAVRWDFDPEERDLTPLAPASRYFAEFPWEGEEAGTDPP